MNAPDKDQWNENSMPDSFGTGKQPVRQKSYLSITLVLLLILLGANLVAVAVYIRLHDQNDMSVLKSVFLPGAEQVEAFSSLLGEREQPEINPAGKPLSDAEICRKLCPSIVEIAAQSDPETAIGSGIVLSQDGYILTNADEIGEVHALCVVLSDGSEHTAVCIGSDDGSNLAVLKIEAEKLQPAELGSFDSVRSGDRLRMLSECGTLKEVTVCEADKTISLYGEQMQLLTVDSQEKGFLVNYSGQVIALRIGADGKKSRMLPAEAAKKLANDLINYGCINPEASLGIQVSELSEIQRRYWQLPEGVMISGTALNSSAYLAGIQTGDILLQIDAWRIKNADDYQAAMQLLHPGDTVQLLIYRLGQEYSVTVVMQNEQGNR